MWYSVTSRCTVGISSSLTSRSSHPSDNVNMAQNALTGTIPNLSLMKDLRNLLLYHNKFTGTIPTTLFSLTNLGRKFKECLSRIGCFDKKTLTKYLPILLQQKYYSWAPINWPALFLVKLSTCKVTWGDFICQTICSREKFQQLFANCSNLVSSLLLSAGMFLVPIVTCPKSLCIYSFCHCYSIDRGPLARREWFSRNDAFMLWWNAATKAVICIQEWAHWRFTRRTCWAELAE